MELTQDLADPAVVADPHEYYGRLRETDPVYWNEKWDGWIVTPYDDVEACLQNTGQLSVEAKNERLSHGPRSAPTTANMISRWMVFRDPPEHTRLRALTLEAFNAKAIEERRPRVEEITASLIDDIEQRNPSEIEFVREFAYLLPVWVISDMLGIPSEDKYDIKDWSTDIALTLFLFYGDEDRRQKTERSVEELSEYLREIVRRRKAEPRDDLITYLTEAEAEGGMLDEDEVVATAMLLLFAGHETTTNLLANGMLELLRHPDQMDLLREDPSLTPSAVEEMLRYQGPIKAVIRTATEDFEFRGNRIESGDRLLLSLAAANRDPDVYEDPDRFDVTRDGKEHVAFGGGVHYCVGAPLARLEASVAFPAFLEAFPDIELATDDVEWRPSAVVRGLEELRLRV